MNKTKYLLFVLFSFVLASNVQARTCEETVYDICIRQESYNSDASRGGMSKEEFCRIAAHMECTEGQS